MIRVAAVYAVVAWLVIQIAATTFPSLSIPEWALSLVIMCVLLGFPISVVLTWAFELTPEGIKTTKTARDEHAEAAEHAHVQSQRNWLAYVVGAAVPTLIFGALALFFYTRSGGDAQASDRDKSVAVLPLTNMSPDPDHSFFADGVQEDIITNLSKIKDLLVITRSSTLQYRNPDRNLLQIGEDLHVRYLVEGSVRRAGNQVLVTAKLIDTQSDGHIWAENYPRNLDDIFAIQAEISKEIAGQLQAAISPDEIARIERRPTENQDAYDYFLKAREKGELSLDERQLCEKAVALDPEFAEAWTVIARSLIYEWRWTKHRNDSELFARAHHAFEEAKRWGPGLAETFRMQNMFAYNEQNDIEASIEYMLKALAIEPNSASIQGGFAWRYVQLGRLTEALHHYEAAYRKDPLSLRRGTSRRFVATYELGGMWDKANALIQENLERSDDDGFWRGRLANMKYNQTGDKQAFIAALGAIPGFLNGPIQKAWMALQAQNYTKAIKNLEELNPDSFFNNYHYAGLEIESVQLHPLNLVNALIWFELGNEKKWLIEAEKAKTHLKEIVENVPLADPWYWSNLTISYALEGERNQMELTINKARELTSSEYYKYFNQVECEIHIAIAYLVLGDDDKAIETLEAASKMDSPIFLNRELDLWFIFDRLRGDPRFDKLL